jgi:hypothetical protein
VNAVLSGVFLDPSVGAATALPRVASVRWVSGICQLEWEANPGAVFRVWSALAVTGAWEASTALATSADGHFRHTDRALAAEPGARFFRLELLSSGDGPLVGR